MATSPRRGIISGSWPEMPADASPSSLPSQWHWTTHLKHVVIAGVIAVVVLLVAIRVSSVWADVAKARQTQAEAALKDAQARLKQAADDRAASDASYQQTVAQVLASNAALARQMADRDARLRDS